MVTSRWKRPSLIALAGLLCAVTLWYAIDRYQRNLLRQQLEIPREWGRLSPYPASAKNLRSSTSGSALTRSFRVRFSAPGDEIERWLKESPGTRDVVPEQRGPGQRRYLIKPGGGAQHAEVNVDDEQGLVSIYVYWS